MRQYKLNGPIGEIKIDRDTYNAYLSRNPSSNMLTNLIDEYKV